MALTRPKLGQINTNVTVLNDAITVLSAGANQANVDVGFLINRAHGLVPNAAFYYSETLDRFVTAFTANSGGTDSNILVTDYADFTAGNVYTTGLYWTGNGQPINFATGTGSGNITVRSLFSGNLQPNVTVANITAIEFDEESGFDIQNRGSGNVLVAMNSTFKYWEVTGSDQLVAVGLDHITINSGNNISITSNANATPYKSITFGVVNNPTFVGNVTATGNIVGGGVRTTTGTTKPTNPTPGDMWYDTSVDVLYRYTNLGTGSFWLDINGQTNYFTSSVYTDVNVAAYLTGNITVGNISSTGYYWANGAPFVSGTSGATGLSSTEATANVSMVNNYRYICNTTTTAITLTLPASAVIGDEVGVIDGTGNCSVNNITVARNGHKIQGLSEDLTVSTNRAAFTLVYYNAGQGWLLTQV